jgi:hypothetical protein
VATLATILPKMNLVRDGLRTAEDLMAVAMSGFPETVDARPMRGHADSSCRALEVSRARIETHRTWIGYLAHDLGRSGDHLMLGSFGAHDAALHSDTLRAKRELEEAASIAGRIARLQQDAYREMLAEIRSAIGAALELTEVY